ncbi:MAG: GNAT family N-acetyltransferase [Bacteroidales bacterium]
MIDVKRAERVDIPTIVDFQIKMAFETEGFELNKGSIEKGVLAVFDDPSKGFYIVAVKQEEVIACLMLTPEWSDWRNGFFLWIQSLYVEKEFRGQGVFGLMYAYVQSQVRSSNDYKGIRLYVDLDNVLAQEVYKRIGMEESHYKMFEWIKSVSL